jgi:trehalose 6-phosphate phosphatase
LTYPAPDAATASLVVPLLARPESSAVLTDFDGTLAPIVADPSAARPSDGAARILQALVARFGVVAVVSGRPVAFLQQHLGAVGGLLLAGLYGLERATGAGPVTPAPGVDDWRSAVTAARDRLVAWAPEGVRVEGKGLAVTVHWRQAPDRAAEAEEEARGVAAATGLRAHAGRASVELRPPLPVDKGTVVDDLCAEARAACYLGDDTGDLAAFDALGRLASRTGATVVRVAAAEPECPSELLVAADAVVDGPAGALGLLTYLASATAD